MMHLFQIALAGSVAFGCGYKYEPTPEALAMPLPPAAQVIEVDSDQIKARCNVFSVGNVAHGHLDGCAVPWWHTAFVPSAETWHGSRACLMVVREHEETHLKDGTHDGY